MPFDDHTPATEIQAEFGISKKAFKRGLGKLYRLGRIKLLPRGVQVLTPPHEKIRRKKPNGKGTRRRPENDPPNRSGRL